AGAFHHHAPCLAAQYRQRERGSGAEIVGPQRRSVMSIARHDLSLFGWDGELICGVDEAGRGPLAGPVFAAAVILDPESPVPGLRDSKALTPARREALAALIRRQALAWAIGSCSEREIDAMNILQASLLAMRRAIEA